MCEEYNGWRNLETWAFVLHVSNDEGLADMARERLAGVWNGSRHVEDFVRDARLADDLEAWAGELFTRAGYVDTFGGPWPDALADVAGDIGSLWRVDWPAAVEALR